MTWLVPLIFWSVGLGAGAISYFGVFLKSLKDAKAKTCLEHHPGKFHPDRRRCRSSSYA